VQKFTRMENFNKGHMSTISQACAALCVWVKAVEEYAQALKVVLPKREKKEAAEAKVAAMEKMLAAMEAEYNAMMAEVEALEAEYQLIVQQMEDYRRLLEQLSLKIDRGEQLVQGLGGEKTRW